MSKQLRWLVALLMAGAIFPAAADDGKPRYVAESGNDSGDCQNRFRPCRSLDYAISKAGKGDAVRVAEGRYGISDTKQLLDLLAVTGRISGGFRKISGYSERSATADTVLIGVPPEFRERFEAAGFTVIVDTKGLDISGEEAQRMRKLTTVVAASERNHALTPCVSNVSSGFACQSIGLLSHLSLQNLAPASSRGNDVWGFVDLNTGREYAFMGLQNGVAVLDVTNPEAPEQVGAVTGSATTWRDIKVYQRYDAIEQRWHAYAYVSADAVPDLLMVLDLHGLPNGVGNIPYNWDFRSAHNAYITNVDYTYGLAQTPTPPQLGVAGSNQNSGNFRLYSLDNPIAPQLQSVNTTGYAHDLASFPVSDARKNSCGPTGRTQPVCQVMSDFNENTVDLWDVTSPNSPVRLSSQPYGNASYVHSGWWTEDGRYLLVHDELDEQNAGLNTTVRVFDVANLTNPSLAGSWVGPTRAIDHNGYVKGNRYFVSNYSEGLTVLDLTNPAAPVRVGYFDTYPASSATSFVGAWGVYPFFASGTIAVGDINSGLYLLRNDTLATPRGSFSMNNASQSGIEGNTVAVTVSRSGGTSGAVSVQLEVLHANTTSSDATLGLTVLSWADGDGQPKIATLNLSPDAQAEDLELLLVRLKSPQGGATIAYPDTSAITIADVSASTRLRSLILPAIDEARGKAIITVRRHGSATGEARLAYRTIPGGLYTGVTAAQGELVWADGDTTSKLVTLQLNPATLSAGNSATFQVELFNPVGATLEDVSGTSVSSLPILINVVDNLDPPAPPPPSSSSGGGSSSSSGGGGGGAFTLLGLLPLLLLACDRSRRCKKKTTSANGRVALRK